MRGGVVDIHVVPFCTCGQSLFGVLIHNEVQLANVVQIILRRRV